jgi:hypothetical protein
MPRPSSWSEAELAALRSIRAGDRAALRAFRDRFPVRSDTAIATKLSALRRRRQAPDVPHQVPDLRLKPRPPRPIEPVAKIEAPFEQPRRASPEELMAAAFATIGHDFGGPRSAG